MPVSDLKRVKAVFSEAMERTGPDREAFIDQACGDDLGLRDEVQSYLLAAEEAGDFLDSPRSPLPTSENSDTRTPQLLGSTIGHYKLIELIGEGGFGSVFMAEQQQPVHRQVALKIIKLGMDTQRVIARFEAERQALAIMDHPNIARVFDAGATETGRPYFVMELVRGVPITEHCDVHRLSTVQRLSLFVIVCNAIQHAHNKGVIHRDIKPSNVLVTIHDGAAVPKVIDFGIAKATDGRLTDRTQFTEARQFIGTPAYMSPEQAGTSGLDIDTRTDIYSLGVLLYELLTGTTPFDCRKLSSAVDGDVQRIIREVDPPKPSTQLSTLGDRAARVAANRNAGPQKLRQLIRGELDWIVMKAIEKDRARRYETANELARDIQRHLNDEPIEACPPTMGYRLRKFVRRNRAAVLTTAVFIITVAAAVGAYIHGMRSEQRKTDAALTESQHQKTQADQRRNEAQHATLRALAAEAQANAELVRAAITQAQGARASTRSGRRFDSLKLLATAAKISPTPEVRSQAIACLGVADMRIARQWTSGDRAVCFNHACTQYADCTAAGEVLIRQIPDALNPDGKLIVRLPARAWTNPLHPDGSARVVFSPGDQKVAVACDDRHVRIFTINGQLIFDVPGGPACDFSPDGAAIATNTPDGPVSIHDLKTGNNLNRLSWPGTDSILFSPNGRKLAMWNINQGTGFFIGDIATGTFAPLSCHAPIANMDWHASGNILAAAVENHGVYLWNISDARQSLPRILSGHVAPVTAVSFSHSGDLLASASDDGTVRLWDPIAGEELVRLFHCGTLRFSTDDRTLAVAAPDGKHALIEVASGSERRTLSPPSANRERVSFSRDDSLLACEGGRMVRFWNLTALWVNDAHVDLKFSQFVRAAAFHPNGKSVIISTDAGLSRTSIEELSQRPTPNPEPAPLPIRRLQIGAQIESLLARPSTDDGAAEMSRDGHVALSQFGQDVMVLDLSRPTDPLTLSSSADTAFISISPDAKWVATAALKGSSDRRVRIWDARTGKLSTTLPIHDANVAFSPDNHWLATVTADELRFWEVNSWQSRQRRRVKSSLSGHIFFSPDSRIVAFSSQQMGVRLIDVNTIAELATLEDEGDERPLGFSSDGSLLATKARNFTIRLWDLRRIRAQLRPMGLDWPEPPLPPERVQPRIDLLRPPLLRVP